MKRRLIPAAAALYMLLSGYSMQTRHYDVRRDLSFYFSNADSVIDTVRRALREKCSSITIEYSSSGDNMSDISAVVSEMMMFAMSETDDPCEGDYIYHQYGGYELNYSSTRNGETYSYTVTVIPQYFTDPAQEREVDARVTSVLSGAVHDGMSEAEKARAIYDLVCESVSYDRVHKNKPHYHLKSTAYGALINGAASCQGYSVLMYRLLREAGLDARIITGNAVRESGTSEYHAWNIVRIGDKYYNIDATWDDLTGTDTRFLKGESEFGRDHIRDPEYCTEEFLEKYPVSDEDFCL